MRRIQKATLANYVLLASIVLLTSCGGATTVKQTRPAAPTHSASQPSAMQKPADNSRGESEVDASAETNTETKAGAGGYYLDDGPSKNVPENIDNIPSATLKIEQPNQRANRPYMALGRQYAPMKNYAPYKTQGIASWYGKRFHGKKTSTGEIYDMYAMSAAHTVLPIPSYAKVTNPANGRSVIVRVNDRGPFIGDRLIDLSYAAAYQLRLVKQGKGLVEVEAIDVNSEMIKKAANNQPAAIAITTESSISNAAQVMQARSAATANTASESYVSAENTQYYVQIGAFKYKANSDLLQKKIQDSALDKNVSIAKVYNNDFYRVKLGPYATRNEADSTATKIRRQLNIATLVTH